MTKAKKNFTTNREAIFLSHPFLSDDELMALKFAKVANQDGTSVFFDPAHWELKLFTKKFDYWAGDWKFTAKTKEAKEWAKQYPVQFEGDF